jgi:hypothetical protein
MAISVRLTSIRRTCNGFVGRPCDQLGVVYRRIRSDVPAERIENSGLDL